MDIIVMFMIVIIIIIIAVVIVIVCFSCRYRHRCHICTNNVYYLTCMEHFLADIPAAPLGTKSEKKRGGNVGAPVASFGSRVKVARLRAHSRPGVFHIGACFAGDSLGGTFIVFFGPIRATVIAYLPSLPEIY